MPDGFTARIYRTPRGWAAAIYAPWGHYAQERSEGFWTRRGAERWARKARKRHEDAWNTEGYVLDDTEAAT